LLDCSIVVFWFPRQAQITKRFSINEFVISGLFQKTLKLENKMKGGDSLLHARMCLLLTGEGLLPTGEGLLPTCDRLLQACDGLLQAGDSLLLTFLAVSNSTYTGKPGLS